MRTKKVMLNVSASFLYQIASIVCGLITPRLILVAFGSTYNGVIESATQFLSLVSILNIGIAGATRVALYKTLANNDSVGTSRIMKATNQYLHKVGIAVLLYAACLTFIYPYISHSDLSHTESSLIIAIVSLTIFAEYYFGLSSKTLLSADQAEYVYSLINIFAIIINTVLTAILIKLQQSIFVVKLFSAIIFLISPALMNLYVNIKYKLDKQCEPDYTAINQRSAVAFHSIANIIHNNTDILILTIFTNAKEISVYAIYYLVAGKIKSIMQVFSSGLEASFGNMWARNEINRLRRVFSVVETIILSLTKIAFTCMGLLILNFVTLYTKGVNDVNYLRPCLAILITLAEATFCVRQPYLLLVQASGFYEETKMGAMGEAVVNLTSSIVLVRFLGINGVIIGTLLANLIRTIQYINFTSKKILDRKNSDVIKKILVIVFTSLADFFVYHMIISKIYLGNEWFEWICKATMLFICSSITTIIIDVVFYKKDIFEFLNMIRGVLNNNHKSIKSV